MSSNPLIDRLWTIRDLAAYLNYQESTLAGMVSKHPERLPPRVVALGLPRWEPGVVRAWAARQGSAVPKKGRPRNTPNVGEISPHQATPNRC